MGWWLSIVLEQVLHCHRFCVLYSRPGRVCRDLESDEGVGEPGVGFWTAEMRLEVPGKKLDVSVSFGFSAIGPAGSSGAHRATMWVNGVVSALPPP